MHKELCLNEVQGRLCNTYAYSKTGHQSKEAKMLAKDEISKECQGEVRTKAALADSLVLFLLPSCYTVLRLLHIRKGSLNCGIQRFITFKQLFRPGFFFDLFDIFNMFR